MYFFRFLTSFEVTSCRIQYGLQLGIEQGVQSCLEKNCFQIGKLCKKKIGDSFRIFSQNYYSKYYVTGSKIIIQEETIPPVLI